MNLKRLNCRVKSKTKILIGSCIRQDPDLLKIFLKYLFKIDTINLDVCYFFIDDNVNETSSSILKEYENDSKVVVLKNQEYVIDDEYNNHNWNLNLVNKIIFLKNQIIEYALENDFDYVFFIDSDIIVHKYLLKHLLSKKKDLVSSIFWTNRLGENKELPNVWLFNNMVMYDVDGSYDGMYDSEDDFFNSIKVPGIHKVGYVSSCFLVSRRVLLKGVNYSPIDNVSFVREDSNFSVRACVNDIELFVDSTYPSYHIYNSSDLDCIHTAEKYGYTENDTLKNILSQYMYIRYNTDIQDFEKLINQLNNELESPSFDAHNLNEDENISIKSIGDIFKFISSSKDSELDVSEIKSDIDTDIKEKNNEQLNQKETKKKPTKEDNNIFKSNFSASSKNKKKSFNDIGSSKKSVKGKSKKNIPYIDAE